MSHTTFPADIPVPVDDGACSHLAHTKVPSVILPATSGSQIDISSLSGLNIIFCYPGTGAPNSTIPDSWNAIPGARGCTPQACSFRDLFRQLLDLGVKSIFGVSTQDTEYQSEAKERLKLPYELLSDKKGEFVKALSLPTFEFEGMRLMKRLTLAVVDGEIVRIWYPVFPPDRSAGEVLEWLEKEGGEKK